MPDRVFPRGRGALCFLVLTADALFLPAADWLSAALAGGAAALLWLLWFAAARATGFSDGFALLARLPRALFVGLCGAAAFVSALLALCTAGQGAVFLSQLALPGAPSWLAAAVLVLTAWAIGRGGPPALCLWAVPVAWAVTAVLVLSLALTDAPLALPPAVSAAHTLPLTGSVFGFSLPLVLFTGCDPALPQGRSLVGGLLAAAASLSLCALRAQLVLGAACAARLSVPVYAAAGLTALPRSEAVFGAAIVLCLLARIALLLTSARLCLDRMLRA